MSKNENQELFERSGAVYIKKASVLRIFYRVFWNADNSQHFNRMRIRSSDVNRPMKHVSFLYKVDFKHICDILIIVK